MTEKPAQQSTNNNPGTNVNPSNQMKVYAKLENNFHLSNKYALFYNMRRYYNAVGRDPFIVLPVTFHVKKGVKDPVFFQFLDYFNGIEAQKKRAAKNEARLRAGIKKL